MNDLDRETIVSTLAAHVRYLECELERARSQRSPNVNGRDVIIQRTKAGWIRAYLESNPDAAPKDVVGRAKEQGRFIHIAQVYEVRKKMTK
jgi:hypothetical protein